MKRKLPESSGASPGTEENFVDRWSRLKRDATGGGPGSQTSSGMREAGKALTDEDMPDIESLTPDSDYTGFLSPQVSDGLRRLALRKLFQGAEFNIRDGLDDYDQDFTGFAGLGSVVTADMKHLLEQEKRHVAEREAERGRDDMSNAHSKPRTAALAAMEQVQVTPTGMVEYRAGGTLAIIGGSEAVAAADRLPAALSAKVLLVADGVNEAPLHIRVEQESLKLEGYLGAFRVLFTQAGKPMEMEVDMVLDLSAQPLLPASLPPPGYIHCAPDEDAIKAAVERLEQLTGTFDKPEYFRYDPDRCAHARNGVIACTRCIDACPAQAIHSLLERVKVDPYLCQGGGICATVCPSGAIGYAYPTSGDLGRRLRRLLQAFRDAGGTMPVLLFHAGESLSETELRAEVSLLPIEVEEVASVGVESWLSALAWGAHRVVLELGPNPSHQVKRALHGQLQVVWEILRGMDYPDTALLVSESGKWRATTAPGMPDIEPATHAAMDDKRTSLYLALDHLHDQTKRSKRLVSLLAGAPFGAAIVEARSCTLCMACAGVCPTHALMSGQGVPQLRFIETNCIQCGLCTRTCPENAISITPRILFDREERNRPRVLHEEEPFCCISCGKPFATRSVVDKMLAKLSGHWMFQNERARQRLQMCDDCRVADIVQDPEAMQESEIFRQ